MNDWNKKFEFSRGENEKQDLNILQNIISGCSSIEKTDVLEDKRGIDYVATLRGGAKINIDAKRREKGCSRYWKHGEPELALEVWSVKPNNGYAGKAGWTLNECTDVDLILYGFSQEDCDKIFLLPFQHLRMAFRKNFSLWANTYGKKEQQNASWKSEAIFVPASVVKNAILELTELEVC